MADSIPIFNSELVKNKEEATKFVAYLQENKLDVRSTMLLTDNKLLLGIYLDYFEKQHNVGIHADHCSVIVFYLDPRIVKKGKFPFYKHREDEITCWIHEDYAKELTDMRPVLDNYCRGVLYVLRYLLLPF